MHDAARGQTNQQHSFSKSNDCYAFRRRFFLNLRCRRRGELTSNVLSAEPKRGVLTQAVDLDNYLRDSGSEVFLGDFWFKYATIF
jgi:hypothetical protein